MDFQSVAETINSYLYGQGMLYLILLTGIVFTVWSIFMQYRALTHGAACVAGRYSDGTGAGALSHFQALSTALSATVGLGNIGGVALAIAIGGPGAVFWMWVVGFLGMAIKSTEVILTMLYRDTTDPYNTRGGPMWVAEKVFSEIGNGDYKRIGVFIGFLFSVAVILAALVSGNYFQASQVAGIFSEYHGIPPLAIAITMMVLVGFVIIGGVQRIGQVASAIVPFMCLAYVSAGVYILVLNSEALPGLFGTIIDSAFNPTEAVGAFVGASVWFAFYKGMQRALFSSEAGAGSAPIAHSSARGKEPVREGIVAGIEPFIDTLVVCTISALVILNSGIWNRDADVVLADQPALIQVEGKANTWNLEDTELPKNDLWVAGKKVYMVVEGKQTEKKFKEQNNQLHKLYGQIYHPELPLSDADKAAGTEVKLDTARMMVKWESLTLETPKKGEPEIIPTVRDAGVYREFVGAVLTAKAFEKTHWFLGQWLVPIAVMMFAFSTMIAWSYYGEQGVRYIAGDKPVMAYRIVYVGSIILAGLGLTETNQALTTVSEMGFGFMFLINVPLTLCFGYLAMRAYKDYIARLKAGLIRPVKK